jgi:endonuclease/exonuclease/phosphatase (EEP) superfamily protein YafD
MIALQGRSTMHILARTTRRVLLGATCTYCAAVFVLVLLSAILTPAPWWLNLTRIFMPVVFAPLLLIVPAALLLRIPLLRTAACVTCALFIFQFAAQLIPPASTARAIGVPLRVTTFNLHAQTQDAPVAELLTAIRAQQADVVALQELSFHAAEAIRQALHDEYPYQLLVPSASYEGIGLISRHPLEAPAEPALAFPGQVAQVRVGAAKATIVNVSLTTPELKRRRLPGLRRIRVPRDYKSTKRSREIAALLRTLEATRGPRVIAGDFNMSDQEDDYKLLAAQLQDSYRSTSWGFGYTYPNGIWPESPPLPMPLLRIDYVWTGGGAMPTATRIECSPASDHCLLSADLDISAGAH